MPTKITDYNTIDPTHLYTAKAKGDEASLGREVDLIWRDVQKGLRYQADQAIKDLNQGRQAAAAVEVFRAQGNKLLGGLALIESNYEPAMLAAMALWGYTEDEVDHSFAYLKQTCEMMANAAVDGSDLATVANAVLARITPLATLFG